MPRALTIDEKRERNMEKLEAKEAEQSAPQEGRGRRVRNAFNGTKQKLQVGNGIPGYHLHIFNDEPGRIQTALDGGYEFVSPDEVGGTTENVVSRNTDIGDKVRFLVGANATGEPVYAYLMKIKQEWFEEDQKALQERNDLTDRAIKGGKLAGIDNTGFYDAGIKYQNK